MQKTGRTRKRKKILRRLILTLILLLILGGIVWYAWSCLRAEYTVTYDTYTATTGSISNALSFSGNLSLVDQKTYSASSAATVRNIYVSAGDHVTKGSRLVRLSSGELLTADFDGTVNDISVEEGDEVGAGTQLLRLADFSRMKATVRVDEYDIGKISTGIPCTVTVTSTEQSFSSEIAAVDHISSSGGSVAYYPVTVYADVSGDVLPGMQVTVSVPQEQAEDVVILKVDAISFDRTNQAYVWQKDENGTMVQKNITTGVSNGNYIEITEGLSDGDEVYVEVETTVSGAAGLFSGLFGGQRFNAPAGGFGGGGGNMPDMSSFGDFDFSSMPGRGGSDSGSGRGGGGGFSFPGGGGQ